MQLQDQTCSPVDKDSPRLDATIGPIRVAPAALDRDQALSAISEGNTTTASEHSSYTENSANLQDIESPDGTSSDVPEADNSRQQSNLMTIQTGSVCVASWLNNINPRTPRNGKP
jgi:hypothetical protein